MNVEVNYVAVLLATLSTLVVGSVWYSPKVFGRIWMKLAKLKQSDMEKNATKPIIITIVVSLVSAFVLAHVVYLSNRFFGNSFLQDSLMTSFWVWLGFNAARITTHDAFEGRPHQLTLLTVSHEFVTFMVMGAVIGLVGV